MTSIVQRFNGIRWHDSKLLALSFYRTDSEELVKISLQLCIEGHALNTVDLILKESTYVKLEVDLQGKRECADDIWEAECSAESDFLRTLSEQNPYDSFKGYLHFRISLIPPGGVINILAKDFLFEPLIST